MKQDYGCAEKPLFMKISDDKNHYDKSSFHLHPGSPISFKLP